MKHTTAPKNVLEMYSFVNNKHVTSYIVKDFMNYVSFFAHFNFSAINFVGLPLRIFNQLYLSNRFIMNANDL